jgi:hypothetical protein
MEMGKKSGKAIGWMIEEDFGPRGKVALPYPGNRRVRPEIFQIRPGYHIM